MIFLLSLGQKHRDELIPSFPNLATSFFKGYELAKFSKRLLPSTRVKVDGIRQGSANVENGGFGHLRS